MCARKLAVVMALLMLSAETHVTAQTVIQNEQTMLTSPTPSHEGGFGWSVATHGNQMAVWGPGASYVYMYGLDQGNWRLTSALPAAAGGAGYFSNQRLSLTDDFLVVGAQSNNAFMFHKDNGTWSQQCTLTATGAAQDSGFGYSAAVSGNIAVVGSEYARDAYVFRYNGAIWQQEAKLSLPGGCASSVAISGDTIVISNGKAGGSVSVFRNTGTAWTQEASLTSPLPPSQTRFGRSTAIEDDRLVVGDDLANRAYVYERSGSAWSLTSQIRGSDTVGSDYFGSSVALDGNYISVGAADEGFEVGYFGAAYLYQLQGSTWTEKTKLQASQRTGESLLGYSVAIDDGYVIAGAPRWSGSNSMSGAVYVYTVPEPATIIMLMTGAVAMLRRRSMLGKGY